MSKQIAFVNCWIVLLSREIIFGKRMSYIVYIQRQLSSYPFFLIIYNFAIISNGSFEGIH